MASFSRSKSNLNLTLPTITGGPASKYSLAGNAVNAANIFKANRAAAPDFAGIVAQNSISEANILNAIKNAEATATMGGLVGYGSALSAKKQADLLKERARKAASKSMAGSALGAVGTIGGAMVGGPFGAVVGGGIGRTLGGLFG